MTTSRAGSFGARPCRAIRARYLAQGVSALPKSWRRSWIIARIVATPPWADFGKIRSLYQLAAIRTKQTGIPHEVDRIYPLQHPLVCGLHVHNNLQVLPAKVNGAKSNKCHLFQSDLFHHDIEILL